MFNVTCNRNEKNISSLWFFVKVNYQPVPIIITDQFNKNVWKSLNSDTVYTKLSQLNNVKSHLWFYLETCLNASVNSTCAQHPPPPPGAEPRALAFFLPWMANSREWGLLSCQIPRGGEEKRGLMPRPPSTLQHFLLIAQSNSAILMCDFLFQLTSSFV